MIQCALIQLQRPLQRRDDFGTTRMAGKAVHIARHQTCPRQNTRDGGRDMLLGVGRYGAVKDHPQPGVIDIPPHDIQRAGPGVLARHLYRCEARHVRLQHAGGGTIGEQCGRHDVFLGDFVHAERHRTQLHRDNQHATARPRLRQPRPKSKPCDPARAAKAKDRHTLYVSAKPHLFGNTRINSGRGKPGRRDCHDRIDIGGGLASLGQRFGGRVNKQGASAFQIDCVTF